MLFAGIPPAPICFYSHSDCHLIATLVKRLWPSYLPGLHIPATRWIWILEGIPGPLRHMCHMPYC